MANIYLFTYTNTENKYAAIQWKIVKMYEVNFQNRF